MGCNFAELKATTTTDWLIGELFSYTELKYFFTVATWHFTNLRLALFPAKRLQNYGVLFTFFEL
jgi:hypothetical protein